MHLLRKPLLAVATASAVIGGGAWAASAYTHHLQVRLPDGEIAQVDYVGDVAPRVVLQPAASATMGAADAGAVANDPLLAIGFPGFGQMDRIFADMERQQAAMLQQVAALEHGMALSGAPNAAMHGPMAGNGNWSYVSSTTTSNGCTETVEWHSQGDARNGAQAQPQVIRTSSGNCDKAVKQTPIHEVSEVKLPAPAVAGKTV